MTDQEQALKDWQEHPLTKGLVRELQEAQGTLSHNLITGHYTSTSIETMGLKHAKIIGMHLGLDTAVELIMQGADE
jgi:hypothetical protein